MPNTQKWCFLSLFLAGAPLLAAYGDMITVEVQLNTVISAGWVVVAQSLSGPSNYFQHIPTKCYMTLKDLNGAPLGEEVEILGQSPIPAGWKVVATSANTGLDRFSYNICRRIRNTDADPAWTGTGAGAAVGEAGLDFDIAAIDWKRQDAGRRAQAEEKKLQAEEAKKIKETKADDERQAVLEKRWPTGPRSYTR